MKPIHIYHIKPGYSKVEVWSGTRMGNSRIRRSTCAPSKAQTRKEKHATISEYLFKNFGIPGPCYKPTVKEKRSAK